MGPQDCGRCCRLRVEGCLCAPSLSLEVADAGSCNLGRCVTLDGSLALPSVFASHDVHRHESWASNTNPLIQSPAPQLQVMPVGWDPAETFILACFRGRPALIGPLVFVVGRTEPYAVWLFHSLSVEKWREYYRLKRGPVLCTTIARMHLCLCGRDTAHHVAHQEAVAGKFRRLEIQISLTNLSFGRAPPKIATIQDPCVAVSLLAAC